MNRTPAEQSRPISRYAPLAAIAAVGVVTAVVLMAGRWSEADPREVFAGCLSSWLTAGWPAAAYMASALGLGRLLRPCLGGATWGRAVEPVLGLALTLFLTNLAASVGVFSKGIGPAAAWVVLIPGLAGGAMSVVERWRGGHSRSPWRLLAYAPVGFMLAAACSPPGWLFGSEGGGYDSLSYHLQLPREWMAAGRLGPLEHNVFSWFPSFVEGAFMHLGELAGPPRTPDAASAVGLTSEGGWRLLSCQMLHTLMTIQCAVVLGTLVRTIGAKVGADGARVEWAAAAARLAFLLTPWTIVVGSLSYNEMPMLTFLGAGLVVVLESGTERRVALGCVLGLLVAGAVGAKPTAVLFVGVPLGAACAMRFSVRSWPVVAGATVVVCVAVLAPWLVRNAMAGPNPIFPLGMHFLGQNHWSSEQADRFTRAVSFGGGVVDRVKLAVMEDATDPAGPRHRGFLHPQWALLWLLLPMALPCVWSKRARAVGAVLAACLLVQVGAWLFATHIQARFLLPCVPVLLAMVSLAIFEVPRFGVKCCAAMVVALSLRGLLTLGWYASERGGAPNQWVEIGPGFFTGEVQAGIAKTMTSAEDRRKLMDNLPPAALSNLLKVGKVYLLGDATPLFWNNAVYNTTWDRWPFAEAVAKGPDDPWAWNATIRAKGVTHVFVSQSELERLGRSGLIDPAVTPERVRRWLTTCGEPVKAWPEAGCSLIRLREGPAQ
ncbi:MAG: hypothetical protein ACOYN0_05825 [Phycisphaerales bacterium]